MYVYLKRIQETKSFEFPVQILPPPLEALRGGGFFYASRRFCHPLDLFMYTPLLSIVISRCTIWSELYFVESFLCRNGPFIYLTISFSFKFNWQQFSMTSMTEPVSENLFIWNVVLWRPYCERMTNDHYTYKIKLLILNASVQCE